MKVARALLALVLLAALAAGMLAWLNELTRGRIADNEARKLLTTLATVLPAGGYDNDPHRDRAVLPAVDSDPVIAYRARRNGRPVAVVLGAVAPDGYVDRIRLLVGIDIDGKITGVRVTGHAETPGLGDGIDTAVSDWILGFDGLAAGDPDRRWRLRRDGGEFDQMTGATVTSRAVVNAVRKTLKYYEQNREQIFAAPAETEARDDS